MNCPATFVRPNELRLSWSAPWPAPTNLALKIPKELNRIRALKEEMVVRLLLVPATQNTSIPKLLHPRPIKRREHHGTMGALDRSSFNALVAKNAPSLHCTPSVP
ncbi:hypothetical protein Salat_1198700 [Sesamum alatum]|uniref:Uncharacterized protein n=1 Tax=Sesamum alatum TaxID=300844 RepID=A0AAE2CNU1_9LAMI|nr:hypothetical protein Salat_1198700 [Sesamum alatum]